MNSKINYDIPFKLYSSCVITKGFNRSTIVDLDRNFYYIIPNTLSELLTKYDGKKISYILKLSPYKSNEHKNIISKYFDFLFENEIIFNTTSPAKFPPINLKYWIHPSEIYQAIIDIDSNISTINSKVFDSLNNLNCKFLQLRLFNKFKVNDIKKILEYLEDKTIIGVDMVMPFSNQLFSDEIIVAIESFLRVNNITFYGAPIEKSINNKSLRITYSNKNISNCKSCGIVTENYFNINLNSYTKSVNYNSCLHGKISIDVNGEIGNCPSLKEKVGNINKLKLEEALNMREFKKYWNVKKDDIIVCQDCEFRHVCTDCRAYIQNPKDIYSKPLKCGYSPYTNKWETWNENPLIKKSIKYYELENSI